jgi:hypothetical protein
MNTFERLDAIIAHNKPDKMPLYFPTIACSVASEILGREVNSGTCRMHFKEELSWFYGNSAHEEFVCKYREDAIELNRKLRADIVRETWRSKRKPTKKLDDYTLLFGEEDGPHIIKRFFPEQQSYGIIEDIASPKDTNELKDRLAEEMRKNPGIYEDELDKIYRDQVIFKKMAELYFPTIAGNCGLGINIHSTAWLEATVLEREFLAEYYMYRAEIIVQHIRWLAQHGFRFVNGGDDFASNQGPVFSPETFKSIFVKPLKVIADECTRHGVVYCYRTDGIMEVKGRCLKC